MIFLSVGTQLPFNRLVSYLDGWVRENVDPMDVFAQVGPLPLDLTPCFRTVASLPADQFLTSVKNCRIFVSHAGMGNIITALEVGRPIVIVPRQRSLGEHRNDHQLHTADKFRDYAGVFVARDYDEFKASMTTAWTASPKAAEMTPERLRLVDYVRRFITDGGPH
jgi:Uncharacterized conserved protein